MLSFARFFTAAASAAILALLLAGCGGTNYGTNAFVSPCVLPSNVTATALVYPAPNSTGNTSSLSQVIVATNGTLPSSWDVVLTFPFTSVYGSQRFGGTITSVTPPFPSPNQLPTFASPTYYTSGFNNVTQPLPPGTVITATLNDTASNCSPGVTVASFST